MGRALNATTVVRDPRTTAVVTLLEGTEVPDWAEDQVGDHLYSADDDTPDATGDDGGKSSSEPAGEPPRAGRGSGLDVWKAYAEGLGLEVPDDAQRDDIVALVDQHTEL